MLRSDDQHCTGQTKTTKVVPEPKKARRPIFSPVGKEETLRVYDQECLKYRRPIFQNDAQKLTGQYRLRLEFLKSRQLGHCIFAELEDLFEEVLESRQFESASLLAEIGELRQKCKRRVDPGKVTSVWPQKQKQQRLLSIMQIRDQLERNNEIQISVFVSSRDILARLTSQGEKVDPARVRAAVLALQQPRE